MQKKIALTEAGLLVACSVVLVLAGLSLLQRYRQARVDACEPCLPPGASLSAEFVETEGDQIPGIDSRPNPKLITVRAKLMQLLSKARQTTRLQLRVRIMKHETPRYSC